MARNYRDITVTAVILTVCATFCRTAEAEDWPQFLGSGRNGICSETGLISEFPAAGPELLWKQPLGVGMSSVAVSEGLAVTLFQDGTSQYVAAFDVSQGTPKWQTAVAPAFQNAMGNGPRATPTIAAGLVHVYTGEGVLAQLDFETGKLNWTVNVPRSLGGRPAEYGVACSPVVTEELVIVQAGCPQAATAAWKISDGQLQWKSGSAKSGYASPLLTTLAGREQLVVFNAAGAAGLDPASGQQFWNFPFPTEYDCNTATPVRLTNQQLLISAGENHGSVLLQIEKQGTEMAATSVWSSLGTDSQLRAEWQTPVVHDGYLYALDNQGSAGPITNLVCIRLSDRTTMWKKSRFGKSNLILADGKLWISTMKGELVLAMASPESYQELARCTLIETTRQAPVISNGRLYLRDDHELLCLKVTAKN